MEGKNLRIELLRFLASVYIVGYHYLLHNYGINTGGYIFVEFFFIVSGFLLYQKAVKHTLTYPDVLKLTFRKAARVYPYYLFAFLMVFLVNDVLIGQAMPGEIFDKLVQSLPEILMVRWGVNGVAWFLITMLVGTFVILFFMTVNRDAYLYCIAPFTILFIYLTFYQNLSTLQDFSTETIFSLVPDSYLRGYAALSLGVLAGAFHRRLLSRRISPRVLKAVGWGSLAGVVVIAARHQAGIYEYLCIGLLFLCVSCLFADNQAFAKHVKAVQYLGSLSLSIYLNQYIFDGVLLPIGPLVSTGIIIVINLLFAVVSKWGIDQIVNPFRSPHFQGFLAGWQRHGLDFFLERKSLGYRSQPMVPAYC